MWTIVMLPTDYFVVLIIYLFDRINRSLIWTTEQKGPCAQYYFVNARKIHKMPGEECLPTLIDQASSAPLLEKSLVLCVENLSLADPLESFRDHLDKH